MTAYDFKLTTNVGEEFDMATLNGKVTLIVNTATGCGFTPQYEALENLYQKYHDKGFEIIDVPCNQFANQTPGTDEEITQFCSLRFKTTFPRMTKSDVNGENELPLFTYLKAQIADEEVKGIKNKLAMKAIEAISKTTKEKGDIKWNFTKFLIGKDGVPVGRYSPVVKPEEIEKDIAELLKD